MIPIAGVRGFLAAAATLCFITRLHLCAPAGGGVPPEMVRLLLGEAAAPFTGMFGGVGGEHVWTLYLSVGGSLWLPLGLPAYVTASGDLHLSKEPKRAK